MNTVHTASLAPTTPKDWSIICDFDGTIAPFDVTDAILDEFAHPSWKDVEYEWLSGKITARACMQQQVELIDAPPRALDAWLDHIPLTDGFREFAGLCKTRGLNLIVVSDGLDYAIKRILFRHGVGVPVLANRLRCRGDSGYRLEFPYGVPGCASGVCKCAVAKAMGGEILLIGDGRSDCCVAGAATLVLAKQGKELKRRCVSENYLFREFDDFFDVAAVLEETMQPWQSMNVRAAELCAS